MNFLWIYFLFFNWLIWFLVEFDKKVGYLKQYSIYNIQI